MIDGKFHMRLLYKQAMVRGEKKGREKERRKIALQLLKLGMDPLLVSKATGLFKAEINNLED